MIGFLENQLSLKQSTLRDMDNLFKDAGIYLSEHQIWDDLNLEQIEVIIALSKHDLLDNAVDLILIQFINIIIRYFHIMPCRIRQKFFFFVC